MWYPKTKEDAAKRSAKHSDSAPCAHTRLPAPRSPEGRVLRGGGCSLLQVDRAKWSRSYTRSFALLATNHASNTSPAKKMEGHTLELGTTSFLSFSSHFILFWQFSFALRLGHKDPSTHASLVSEMLPSFSPVLVRVSW